jgi:integrase
MQRNDQQSESESFLFAMSSNEADSADAGFALDGNRRSRSSSSAAGRPSDCSFTFSEFVAARFLPDHITGKTNAGRRHYQAILKHVVTPKEVSTMFAVEHAGSKGKLKDDPSWPYLSRIPLVEVNAIDVQRLISAAVEKGYSAQTVKHIRNAVRVIFSHAIKHSCFFQENPAANVVVPDMSRRETRSLSLNQIEQLFQRMHYPEREIALFAILTSMSIAEICGLQWMFVNMTDHIVTREGISIPPKSIAVRNQWYRGEFSAVPASKKKDIPITSILLTVLRSLAHSRPCTWHDFVLATKSGRPINQVNLAARRLKGIGMQLDMPWISWQVLRRTRRSIFQEYESRVQDQLSKVILPVWTNRMYLAVNKIPGPPPR